MKTRDWYLGQLEGILHFINEEFEISDDFEIEHEVLIYSESEVYYRVKVIEYFKTESDRELFDPVYRTIRTNNIRKMSVGKIYEDLRLVYQEIEEMENPIEKSPFKPERDE